MLDEGIDGQTCPDVSSCSSDVTVLISASWIWSEIKMIEWKVESVFWLRPQAARDEGLMNVRLSFTVPSDLLLNVTCTHPLRVKGHKLSSIHLDKTCKRLHRKYAPASVQKGTRTRSGCCAKQLTIEPDLTFIYSGKCWPLFLER